MDDSTNVGWFRASTKSISQLSEVQELQWQSCQESPRDWFYFTRTQHCCDRRSVWELLLPHACAVVLCNANCKSGSGRWKVFGNYLKTGNYRGMSWGVWGGSKEWEHWAASNCDSCSHIDLIWILLNILLIYQLFQTIKKELCFIKLNNKWTRNNEMCYSHCHKTV